MKKIAFILTVLCSSVIIMSCGGQTGDTTDVNTTPESVVQAVFDAAKSGDFSKLGGLCDPRGENDGDTRKICELEKDMESEFVEYFKEGKVAGDAVINGDQAEVPILFGPEGGEEETMKVVQRDGKWYLMSF